jgi:hypothetical protein
MPDEFMNGVKLKKNQTFFTDLPALTADGSLWAVSRSIMPLINKNHLQI